MTELRLRHYWSWRWEFFLLHDSIIQDLLYLDLSALQNNYTLRISLRICGVFY
jgi:hypothetical protein